VLSIVSQSPAAYGHHFVSWTQALVVEELASMGIAASRSTVQRILARQDIDIRTVRYWLWTPRNRPEYEERRDAICELYLSMARLPHDEIVVCFDAKPGIQILGDPRHGGGSYGPRASQPRRIEFEYRRHGTRGFVAAVRPDTGEVVHHDVYDKDRRFNSTETVAFLERLRTKLAAAGYRRIHLVLDNGSTHRSAATTTYLAEHASWFTTYFTPVHASWLNLCENFFSTFSRRYLRHRRYRSVGEFVEGLPQWVDDHNQRARPLRWTYAPHQRAA
jgi:transposase